MKKSYILTGLLFASLVFAKSADAADIDVNNAGTIGTSTISYTANNTADLWSENTTDAFYSDFTKFDSNIGTITNIITDKEGSASNKLNLSLISSKEIKQDNYLEIKKEKELKEKEKVKKDKIKKEKEEKEKKEAEALDAKLKAEQEAQEKEQERLNKEAEEYAKSQEKEVATDPVLAPSSNINYNSGVAAAPDIAKQYLGVPYWFGGEDPSTGFDCSGLVVYVYNQLGISLPRTAGDQLNSTTPISFDQLQPGDLLFWGGSHVAIYIGGGNYIHSPQPGESVTIQSMSAWSPYSAGRI